MTGGTAEQATATWPQQGQEIEGKEVKPMQWQSRMSGRIEAKGSTNL